MKHWEEVSCMYLKIYLLLPHTCSPSLQRLHEGAPPSLFKLDSNTFLKPTLYLS